MERLSSFTIFDSSHDRLRIASDRVGIKFGQIYGWFKDKSHQIRSLPGNDDLIQAVFSPEKLPVEGSRYRVGDCISVYNADGERRRFKICGVQSGGFSNVYTVIDLDEMRPYCLKENRAIPGNEIKKNEKLAVEADISLRLGLHPNLVTTYSAFYIKSRLFILTEYLPATSLDLHLKTGLLPLETALRYAVYLCRAVHFAQSTLPGFVHGDIKPGNCFITSEGKLKLGDFGLASAIGLGRHPVGSQETVAQLATETDASIGWGGTAAYMAPEMLDKVVPGRSNADIYAFGVTLFEMLCGRRPFVGASRDKIVEMQRDKEPPLELLAEKSVPRPIIELVARCLAKSPAQRPASFETVENELQQMLNDQFKILIPSESALGLSDSEIARRALSFAILGNFEEAEVCVDYAMRNRGGLPELQACKAIALTLGGWIDRAYGASTAALMMRADLFIVLHAHARVLIARGDFDTAENYLHRALQLRPDNCVTLNLMGDLYYRIGQYDEASIYFEKSLTLDSSQPEPWEELANINLVTGRSGKAISLARKALSLDLYLRGSHRILGDAYRSQNHLVEAIKSYKAALNLAFFSKETARYFVRSCCELYRTAGNNIDFQLLRILIRGTKVLQNADDRTIDSNDFANRFISVFRNSGFNPLLLFFLDFTLGKLADDLKPDISAELCENLRIVWQRSAREKMPSHLLDSMGRVFYHFGAYKNCQDVFMQVLEQVGPNENSFYYLAACSEIQGHFQSSLKFYRKALRIEDCEDTRTGIQRVTAKLRQLKKVA